MGAELRGCVVPRKKAAESKPRFLKITQVRSGVGRPEVHRRTLRALGLRRHQQTVVQPENAAIQGMLFQVRHLVEVSEVEAPVKATGRARARKRVTVGAEGEEK